MRRFLIGFALVLGLFQAAPSLSQVDAARVAVAKAAADEFLRRAEGSATSGQVPRRSDPAVAKLLDTVFDLTALKPAPISQIGPIGELARNGNRVALAYILAGTGKTDTAGADRELLLRIDQNTATFAPEVGQFTDFQILVTETMARSALDLIGSATPAVMGQPNVQSGLAQMRGGFAQTIGGMLKTLTIAGLDTDWKLQRLAALERIADTAERFLGQLEKADVRRLAEQVAAMVEPDLKARVSALARRIDDTAR